LYCCEEVQFSKRRKGLTACGWSGEVKQEKDPEVPRIFRQNQRKKRLKVKRALQQKKLIIGGWNCKSEFSLNCLKALKVLEKKTI
jgi:hypothetical protein